MIARIVTATVHAMELIEAWALRMPLERNIRALVELPVHLGGAADDGAKEPVVIYDQYVDAHAQRMRLTCVCIRLIDLHATFTPSGASAPRAALFAASARRAAV